VKHYLAHAADAVDTLDADASKTASAAAAAAAFIANAKDASGYTAVEVASVSRHQHVATWLRAYTQSHTAE
jgi:hypothetical protein